MIRTRVLPALITALGVTLVAAGILYLGGAADAGAGASASPIPSVEPSISPGPSDSGSASPPPSGSAVSPSPSGASGRVATRIVIPAMGIDLPVVKQPGGSDAYPLCNVAMYIQELSQPGLPGATYIYAHARVGMFLPLLTASQVNDGASMIGMLVQVYTSDDQLFLYEVSQVRRHVPYNVDVISLTSGPELLWLQTSEGPNRYYPKLMVVAKPLSSGPADPAQAHPVPSPVVCG